jgi:hypothetical protein
MPTPNTDQLMNDARCIDKCIPDGEKMAVLVSVLYQLLQNGTGGGGGGAVQQITSGNADPVSAPATPAIVNLYVNLTSGTIWQWNPNTQAWQ